MIEYAVVFLQSITYFGHPFLAEDYLFFSVTITTYRSFDSMQGIMIGSLGSVDY